MKHNYLKWAQVLLFMSFLVGVQAQTTVMLPATKDNSLFSENNNSNGSGDDLFTGRTNQGNLRRTLIQFDLSTIPSDATITDVQLKIRGSRQSSDGVAIHRMNADWGEGTSLATGQGGQGASPTNNDATWNFSFFNTTSWSTAGGDFMPTASASTSVNEGATSNWTGANVVTDVQAWIDGSATNFGWILIGDEASNASAIRMVSRESATNAPELEVTYTVADTCAANGGNLTFADGSTELTICAGDGVADPFMVNLTDTMGTNFAWVITDAAGNILGLPSGPTFDLEGAGAGVCLLWGLSFEDGLMGVVVDSNANDLAGCFDLSNPITVNRDTTGSICITSTENIVSAAEIGFEVFPNPAQDRIQFKADFTERPSSLFIEVRSSVGQLMIRKELGNQRELNETLEINQMTSGIYLITLRTERSVITQRFLKN